MPSPLRIPWIHRGWTPALVLNIILPPFLTLHSSSQIYKCLLFPALHPSSRSALIPVAYHALKFLSPFHCCETCKRRKFIPARYCEESNQIKLIQLKYVRILIFHWHIKMYCRLSHKGSPRILDWVAYPFSSGSSQSRNWTGVSCIAGRFFINCAMREAPINSLKYVRILIFHWHMLKKKKKTSNEKTV